MTDEFTDSKLSTLTPSERAEIRQLAAAVIQAAQGDEECPLGIEPAHDEAKRRLVWRRDVELLVFKLAREIETLAKERDRAVNACREVVTRANVVHDRVHEDARANSDDLRCGDDVHLLLHFCIGAASPALDAIGPREVLRKVGAP